jgi:hypothetical protein
VAPAISNIPPPASLARNARNAERGSAVPSVFSINFAYADRMNRWQAPGHFVRSG